MKNRLIRHCLIHSVSKNSIRGLLYNAYKETQIAYEKANFANDETTRQFNIATTNLNKAQIKLNSLQSGLAAANAAALAS